jgi:DNA-binding IclR family transcriptional regulator
MSKVAKAIDLLKTNPEGLSAGVLAQRLGTDKDSVRSVISKVRREGFVVYANPGKLDSRGRQLATKYRFGAPTKAMVKAMYAAA